MQLTPQQEEVLALISAGSPISKAAQSTGVHRNTIHNWIRVAPDFRFALAQARELKTLYWQEQAEALAARALDTIDEIIATPSTPASVRLKAALYILNLALNPQAESCLLPVESTPVAPSSPEVHKSAQSLPESTALQPLTAPPECTTGAQVHIAAQHVRPAVSPIGRHRPVLPPSPSTRTAQLT